MTTETFFEKIKSLEDNPDIVFELQMTNQFFNTATHSDFLGKRKK